MFCLAALIPSPPILVPHLCGGAPPAGTVAPDESAVAALRAAVLSVGRELAAAASQWTVLATGVTERRYDSGTVGTFAGFGRDVTVSLGGPTGPAPDPHVPLGVLVAGWLRAAVAPRAQVRAQVLATTDPPQRCVEAGARVRAELDAVREPRAVLVVADGAATLSTAAPGYLDTRAAVVQTTVDRALAAGDPTALLDLDPDLCAELMLSGRAAYQALAGLFAGDPEPPLVTERYRDAPYGVGYYAGLWRPAGVPR